MRVCVGIYPCPLYISPSPPSPQPMAVQPPSSSNPLLLNRTPLHPGVAVSDRQSLSNILKNTFPVGNCNQPNVDVSTGLRLAFNDNIHQPYGYASMLSEDNLSALINHQENEIDRYIQAHGEEFRRKLAEKTQKHYHALHALIGCANESALRIIREKETLLEKAARRKAELEARATQLSAEAQVWEAKAKANEAVAAALQAQLQQMMVGCVSQGEVVVGGDVEDAESSYVDPERVVVARGPGCKACGKRVASVVLLPCRHLCVCSECDDVVQTCPLCLSFRSSSIEVYMS